jgi:hypothetical protein
VISTSPYSSLDGGMTTHLLQKQEGMFLSLETALASYCLFGLLWKISTYRKVSCITTVQY